MSDKFDKLIDQFTKLAEKPHETAKEWSKKTGKKVVAVAGLDVPEVVLEAAGMLPLVLLEDNSKPISLANSHVQTHMCGYMRSMIEQVLDGSLDYVEALVMKDCCHEIRMLGDLIHYISDRVKTYFIYFPPTQHETLTHDYMVNAINKYIAYVEKLSGKKITEDDLKKENDQIQKLTDSERDVRLAAIEALGCIKGVKAIDPLIKSLAEQDQQIVEKAEWAVCEMGEVAVEYITKAIESEENHSILPSLVRILGNIGSIKAIFPLHKVLDNVDDPKLSTCIADSLVAIDNCITSAQMNVTLKEGYAWAQFSIAQALANLHDERAFALLVKIARETLTEKDIKQLSGIPNKSFLEYNNEILHLIKLNVAHMFAKVGNDKAIPVIMDYFVSGDQFQRQWCIEALGGIKTEGALDALIDILKKPEYNIPLDLYIERCINQIND